MSTPVAAREAPRSDAATTPEAKGARGVELLARYAVVLVLVVLVVVFSLALPETFPTAGNVRTMVNSQAVVLLLAIAATIPLRTGDFDLSIAAVMTAAAALTAELSTNGVPVLVVLLAVLAGGALVGLVNGFLIVRLGVDAFITTLGMFTALSGAAVAITNSQILAGIPDSVTSIARSELLGLPAATWYAWLAVLIAWWVYQRTPVGRYLLFVGGSREAARLAGLRVDRLRAGAFLGSAMLAALAGFLFAGTLGSVDATVSGQFLLQPFAAAFLGATTIAVGRFNAFGTLVALYLLVVGITGLQLLGAAPWVSDVFNGLALMLAVTFARLAARRTGTAAAA